jgi:hypothetical protein
MWTVYIHGWSLSTSTLGGWAGEITAFVMVRIEAALE